LQELVLLGGAIGAAGCQNGLPCGNANPDPCICGRPDSDPTLRAECNAEQACEADGGLYVSYGVTELDGAVVGPHCEPMNAAADGGDGG
jgi:hypothetical protein